MSTGETIQRVRFYMGEKDMHEGRPLYVTLMDFIQREGGTQASVFQGIAGFSPSKKVSATLGNIGDSVPVVVEWIDLKERIAQVLPLLDEILPDAALVTIESLEVYRAVLRSQGPLSGDQTVGDIMQKSPQTARQSSRLGDALSMMIAGKQSILPILDDKGRIIGIVTENSIAQRAKLMVPLRLIPLLSKEEGQEIVVPIASTAVTNIMLQEWQTITASTFVPQALKTMLEWGYDQIPVLNREDVMMGMLGWSDVLSAVVAKASDGEGNVQEMEKPTPVSLIMQQNVPSIQATQTLATAILQLLKTPHKYLVVTSEQQQVIGTISDTSIFQSALFRGLSSAERLPIIQAMQSGVLPSAASLPGNRQSIKDVTEDIIATIAPRDSIMQAARQLVEQGLERAPVVDEEGRLQGLIGRGSLLRALSQESA